MKKVGINPVNPLSYVRTFSPINMGRMFTEKTTCKWEKEFYIRRTLRENLKNPHCSSNKNLNLSDSWTRAFLRPEPRKKLCVIAFQLLLHYYFIIIFVGYEKRNQQEVKVGLVMFFQLYT